MRLEVSGAVQRLYESLGVKGLRDVLKQTHVLSIKLRRRTVYTITNLTGSITLGAFTFIESWNSLQVVGIPFIFRQNKCSHVTHNPYRTVLSATAERVNSRHVGSDFSSNPRMVSDPAVVTDTKMPRSISQSLQSSSPYICHAVRPPVDPFRSHVSRRLFKGLPRFLLPVGQQCFITLGNLFRGILFACCIQLHLYSSNLSKIDVIFNSFKICDVRS